VNKLSVLLHLVELHIGTAAVPLSPTHTLTHTFLANIPSHGSVNIKSTSHKFLTRIVHVHAFATLLVTLVDDRPDLRVVAVVEGEAHEDEHGDHVEEEEDGAVDVAVAHLGVDVGLGLVTRAIWRGGRGFWGL
jgi:hypothetical protein